MIHHRTTIIVGAGASHEFNLPLGVGLKDEIARMLDIRNDGDRYRSGDEAIREILWTWPKGEALTSAQLAIAAKKICTGVHQCASIDTYIDSHRGDAAIERLGKIAIVRAILTAEQNSTLYFDGRQNAYTTINFQANQNTWLAKFFEILVDRCHLSDLPSRLRNIAFIAFNYDRCIEHFLFESIKNYYSVNADESAQLLKNLQIFHPYGVVGALPWQEGHVKLSYGSDPSTGQIIAAASGIRTFAEGVNPNTSDIDLVRETISQSSMALFLGFAFHEQNMELLRHKREEPCHVYATAFGISKHDCDSLVREINLAGFQQGAIEIGSNLKCEQLFFAYKRAIGRSWHP